MILRSVVCCAALVYATCGWGADKPAKKDVKPAAKPAAKTAAAKTPAAKKPMKAAAKPAAPKKQTRVAAKPKPTAAPKMFAKPAATTATTATTVKAAYTPPTPPAYRTSVLKGPRETLTCRDGTEDRHARIGVVLIGGKVDSFAYYSKWKPRTCSIYLERNRDPYSKWFDRGAVTNVDLERGVFLIEHRKNEYRFVFRDVDRERYCGMDGVINGSLTIRKGVERCEVAGIMDEGIALGQAYAHVEQPEPAAAGGATAAAPSSAAAPAPAAAESAPLGWLARRLRRQPQSTFPSAAEGISD